MPKEVFTKKKYVIPETPETKYVWKTIDVDDADDDDNSEPPVIIRIIFSLNNFGSNYFF